MTEDTDILLAIAPLENNSFVYALDIGVFKFIHHGDWLEVYEIFEDGRSELIDEERSAELKAHLKDLGGQK